VTHLLTDKIQDQLVAYNKNNERRKKDNKLCTKALT